MEFCKAIAYGATFCHFCGISNMGISASFSKEMYSCLDIFFEFTLKNIFAGFKFASNIGANCAGYARFRCFTHQEGY